MKKILIEMLRYLARTDVPDEIKVSNLIHDLATYVAGMDKPLLLKGFVPRSPLPVLSELLDHCKTPIVLQLGAIEKNALQVAMDHFREYFHDLNIEEHPSDWEEDQGDSKLEAIESLHAKVMAATERGAS